MSSLALRSYQEPHFVKLLCSLLKNQRAHDGSDAGTGKTFVGAALAKALNEKILIVAPLSVLPDWKETLDGFGVTNYTLVNYEKAWRRLGEVVKWGSGSYFRWSGSFQTAFFDEGHRCGGETSINSKMLIAAKRQFGRVMTMSATIADTPLRMKAFGYMMGFHAIGKDPQGRLPDWRNFLLKCQCKTGTFGGWTFSAKAHPMILVSLNELIYGGGGLGSRMRKEDIPDFPKTVISVRLLPCVESAVLKLSHELQGFYQERMVTASKLEEQAKRKRREAEANGYESQQSGEELAKMTLLRQALEIAKVSSICDMVEDALETSRVAVFCNFNATVDALCAAAEKRKWKYTVIRGSQSSSDAGRDERTAAIKAFQANQLDVIFCNIKAGGVGVSLHDPVTKVERTSIICPTFESVDLKQALGRVHRAEGGFSRQFLVYFENTFEAIIARVVKNKLNALHLLNDAELCGDFSRIAA